MLGAGREVALVERVWLQKGQSRQFAHLNRIIQVKDDRIADWSPYL